MIGAAGTFDDHGITIENARLNHRITDNFKGEMFATANHAGRNLKMVAGIAQRLNRGAGGNPPEKGKGYRLGSGGHSLGERGGASRAQNFNGAGTVGKAADIAAFLQPRHQTVNPRFRGKAERIAHLIKRGRHIMFSGMAHEKFEKFALLAG